MRKLIVMVIGLTGWILTSAQTANTEKGRITGKLAGTDGKAIAAANSYRSLASHSSCYRNLIED